MTIILPLNGQSNFDIDLQVYGNIDLLIKLAVDNNVEDLSILATSYIYDETNKNINSNFTGYIYSTEYDKSVNICLAPTGLRIVASLNNSITFAWNNIVGLYFEYAYNTTGIVPDKNSTDWIKTTASIKTIQGLSIGTQYFIFLKTVCNQGLCSNTVFISNIILGDFNNDFNNDFNI